jgi:hypothetical protein
MQMHSVTADKSGTNAAVNALPGSKRCDDIVMTAHRCQNGMAYKD